MSGGEVIHKNSDLNDYTRIGNYYCPSDADTSLIQNMPQIGAFTMKIEHAIGNSYPCQTLRSYLTGEIFYRVLSPSTGIWTRWSKTGSTNGLIKTDIQVGEKGQVFLYFGQDLNNCMTVNIDPAGINFRSVVNGVTKRMWDINHN